MPASFEQLKQDMNRIVESNPVMHLATVSAYYQHKAPHSSAVWFAPDDELAKLYWLASPQRQHSDNIDSFKKVGGSIAPVSGSMNLITKPSRPVLGISFEGKAHQLDNLREKEIALGILVARRVFTEVEAAEYLEPPEESTMPSHAVYVAEPATWTHFNGLEQPENRKTVINIPVS